MNRLFGFTLVGLMLGLAAACAVVIASSRLGWFTALPSAAPQKPPLERQNDTEAWAPPGVRADLPEYSTTRFFPVFDDISSVPVKRAIDIADEVRDDELVLGVTLGGEARAYPINQLFSPQREVFNDMLGGQPIAATW
jgi:hypothetical protein